MARSPLFRQITRAFRLAREARRRGVPLRELAEMQAARPRDGLSRRRFLQLSAATAATVPLLGASACGDNGGGGGDGEIAIVGAGMAGLHCAHRLAGLGVAATVYEASARVGGRMITDRATFAPQHCELGGELIDTSHQTMHDLAAELGIALLDYDTDDPTLDQIVAFIGGRKLTNMEILDGFAPIAAEIDAALATLIDQDDLFVYHDKPNGGEALDALSIAAWMDQIGATGPVRTLLEVAYTIEYGLDIDVQNVLNLMFLISTDTATFEVFGESDERFHAADGNDTYIQKLRDSVGDERIALEHQLEALREDAAGRYVLTFRAGGTSVDVVADHVVLALPFTTLREVDIGVELPAVKRTAIDEMGMGANAKLMCGFATRPWRVQGSNGETFADLGYQSTWETSRLQPGEAGILTDYTGGARALAVGEGTPEQRRDEFLAELDQVFPGASAESSGLVVRADWASNPFTKGSYSAYLVGQYTKMAGAEIVRVGNLHFCGEHTSLDAQGYMEGAALTGAIAADEVAADLGLDAAAELRRLAPGSASHRIFTRARATRSLRRWKRGLRRKRA